MENLDANISDLQIETLPKSEVPAKSEWIGPKEKRDDLGVYFERKALEKALDDGKARGSKNESGGVFLGKRYDGFTEILDYVPIEGMNRNPARITFDPDAWSFALREADKVNLDMIGWYHTHPGWGVFLSNLDEGVNEYFAEKGQIAAVFDPIKNEFGVLSQGGSGKAQGTYKRHAGYYVFDTPKIEINLSPQENGEEKLQQAKDLLSSFVIAQEITEDNMDIFENINKTGITPDVLKFVAEQTQKQIAELSALKDPSQRQAAIEQARHLKDIAAAYKLIKEQ